MIQTYSRAWLHETRKYSLFFHLRLDTDCPNWFDQWTKMISNYGRYRQCYAEVKLAWNMIEDFLSLHSPSTDAGQNLMSVSDMRIRPILKYYFVMMFCYQMMYLRIYQNRSEVCVFTHVPTHIQTHKLYKRTNLNIHTNIIIIILPYTHTLACTSMYMYNTCTHWHMHIMHKKKVETVRRKLQPLNLNWGTCAVIIYYA